MAKNRKKKNRQIVHTNPDHIYYTNMVKKITRHYSDFFQTIDFIQKDYGVMKKEKQAKYFEFVVKNRLSIGECFNNAQILSSNFDELTYVEGLCDVYEGGELVEKIQHGFCIDDEGDIIDPVVILNKLLLHIYGGERGDVVVDGDIVEGLLNKHFDDIDEYYIYKGVLINDVIRKRMYSSLVRAKFTDVERFDYSLLVYWIYSVLFLNIDSRRSIRKVNSDFIEYSVETMTLEFDPDRMLSKLNRVADLEF